MSWFKRKDKKIEESTNKKDLPSDLWIKGTCCGEILYKPELEKANSICHHCNFHYPISSDRYLKIILDSDYKELFDNIVSTDILNFKANKSYQDILDNVPNNKEAANCYYGSIDGNKVVLSIMDFKFIGGSMGSAVGEKIAKSVDFAIEKNCPLIIICQSGGARMQEGALSLMQLSKISARLANFSKKGGLYISLLTYPTTGGVTASFGMQADITIAEPKALIGFAGQRVIKQTTSQDLPEGFQTSEFLMDKGFIDVIVDRNTLKSKLINILSLLK
ncbi:MAG: acetyl-coenzyme A carboxylase carboxyl transferase subunit beta [Candidatus Neomarinimicrobiota bacterium]|jgi:acetyl-CoA carboxylase carboxyl transferase subunit beta|nr:MAG: acetyl-coenzyme A carboxylase carboxyl transferase subunit beta [Candidatus Neomarinimicrobiota bacterium]